MAETAIGLTTTKAPFIEAAQSRGELYIEQPYECYSAENQDTWTRLYDRIRPRWQKYAHPKFLEGVEKLVLPPDRVPRLDAINRFLEPLSGFSAKAVSGYIPAFQFFDCLRQRAFPTTITIRDGASLDYLPEPDIFHDVAGHVPMHTDQAFADVLVRFGEVAKTAACLASEITCVEERERKLESVIKAMARFFWFTIEFGLMRRPGGGPYDLCVYGSGLLSSHGELANCIENHRVQRFPFQLEWVINQYFEIDHYQPLLFVIDSFEQLFEQVETLELWMRHGRLGNVSPGEPAVSAEDVKSFIDAAQHGKLAD
jgi:phenylalanine-4-hydroxylase